MKLKDFLKQFENEDPEIEIVQVVNMWGDLGKSIYLYEQFVNPTEIEKELISDWTHARANEKQIRVLKIG